MPIPRFLVDDLAQHVAGKQPDEFLTLDLCGDLYGDRLDEVTDRMDALRTARGLPADFCGLNRS